MPGLESLFWRGIRLQRRRGEEKNCLGPEKFFRGLGAPETRQHRQDKPRQAKGSVRGQMTCSESGWRLAEAVDVSLCDRVGLEFF